MNIRGAVDAYDRTTSPYVVAYLDILGITNRMQHNGVAQQEALNILHNLYTSIIELSDPDKGIKRYSDIGFRVFSDNIIIAKKLSSDVLERRNDIESVLNCVSNFLCSAVGDGVGWLVRGGISMGDFYIDDTVVWGAALLRAYELESKIADYPRIVIDAPLLLELNTTAGLGEYVLHDFDGVPFLNYMSIWHFSGQIVKQGFERMKGEAKRPDGTYAERTRQKLYWHMKYVNQELDKKAERKDKRFRLTMD